MSVVSEGAGVPTRTLLTGSGGWLDRLLLLTLVAALFGQPNALFVYLPVYPVAVTVLIFFLFGAIVRTKSKIGRLSFPFTNLTLPTLLFFAYSLISLSYAPDPFYGARILFSSMFKFLLFFAIVTVVKDKDEFKKIFLVIAALGGLFSLQGLAYVVGYVFFNLQPGDFISSLPGYGARGYNPEINSLGILGFAKVTNQIGSFRLPRCQAMFLEPGFFATFLELSIFVTLGWLVLAGASAKKIAFWLLGLQFGALLFTFSSAGFLAIGSGLFVYALLRLFTRSSALSGPRVRASVKAAAAVLGGVLLLSLCFPSTVLALYNAVYLAKFVSDTTDLTSASDRLGKAADGVALFSQRPLFGWGSNQVPIVSANGESIGNAFLTVSAELGVVGLVIYGAMLAAILWTVIESLFAAYRSRSDAAIGLTAALTGGFVASFIHSLLVDTEWQFSYWIGLALIYLNRRLMLHQASAATESKI